MALLDVIKFDGLRSKEWLIYKHPSEMIKFGSQLIVQEGQVCIFLKGGSVCDVLKPGTHTLSTMNLPILYSLVNIPFGGDTPFPAEIYFVNTTTKLDVYWGTPDPIQLIDPKYFIKLRIRAHGQMGLKLLDPANFFKELIGGMNQADFVKYDKVKEFYRGLIVLHVKSIIAETILNEKISALEIAPKLEEISVESKVKLDSEFEKYGLKVTNFYVQSINFPDEDFEAINQILEDRAAFEIMGDSRYSTMRTFDVYEGAATNQNGIAGAFVAGGIGLGAGMTMASNINNPPVVPVNHTTKNCPHCGVANSINSKYCNECGKLIDIPKVRCPQCGFEMEQNSKFCSQCGYSMQASKCECGANLAPGTKFCPSCGKKAEESK